MPSVPSSERLLAQAMLNYMGSGCRLLELPIQIDKIELVALLDCSAIHNFISQGLVVQHELKQQLVSPLTVTMANTSIFSTDKSVTVPLKFGPTILTLTFQILPTLSIPVVLGMQFLESINLMVDWVNKLILWMDAGKQYTLTGQKWLNSGTVQLVSLDSFYQCVRDADCTGCQKVWIKPQGEQGRINTVKAQKEEPVDPKVAAVLVKYCILFNAPEQLPPTRAITHQIKLFFEAALPPKQHECRLLQEQSQAVRVNVDLYLQCGWIRPSYSQYGHPVLIIRKKDGKLRIAVDYRSLNSKTIPDHFPLPRIDDILDSLGKSSVLTELYLDSGYHQASQDLSDAHKTAFLSKWSLYGYTVLFLGLNNAPATFQHLMNQIWRPQLDKSVTVYLDDIIIYSKNMQEHFKLLQQILDRLAEHQLFKKRSKCKFAVPTIEFLGYIISASGVQSDPSKVESIRQWPVPTFVYVIQVFIGMAGYYSRFVPKYADIAAALTDLLKKNKKQEWTIAVQESFEQLKLQFSTAPILQYPRFDLPFVYPTDASSIAVGVTLLQDQGQGLLPLSYASRKLNSAEQRYSTEDREFLAIAFATVKWRHYLAGGPKRAMCLTDHEPLQYVLSKRDLNKRQSRQIEKLVDINPTIQWVPSKDQVVPYALSRRPDYNIWSSLVVEPSFLGNVSKCMFDSTDVEMSTLVASA